MYRSNLTSTLHEAEGELRTVEIAITGAK